IWAAQYGVAEDGPEGDSDADGYNNFQEFAYGGNPTNAGDIGYAPAAGLFDDGSTNWLTLVSGYRSDTNSGVTYDYLTSGSLTIPAWTNAGITVLGTGTLDADFEVITNAIPIDDTQDFLGVFLEKTE
uniref:hypothetical protein n=1 Tax=Pontiella sp. TaxID=2837462 RepID=UPI0035653E08